MPEPLKLHTLGASSQLSVLTGDVKLKLKLCGN